MVVSQINKAALQTVNLSSDSGKESDVSLKFSQVLEKTKVDSKSEKAEKKTQDHEICKSDTENESNSKDIKEIKDKKLNSDSKNTDIINEEKEPEENQQLVNSDGSTVIAIDVQQILNTAQLTASTPTTDTADSQGTISIDTDININANLQVTNKSLNINSISDVNIKIVPNNTQTQLADQPQTTEQTQTIDQQSTSMQNTQPQITEQPQTTEQPLAIEQTAQTENNISGDFSSTESVELNTVISQNGQEIKTQSKEQSNGEIVVTETQSSTDLSKNSSVASIMKDDKADSTGTKGEEKQNSKSEQPNGNLGVSDGSPINAKTDNTVISKTESSHPLSKMIFNQISDQVISNLKTGNTNFEFELHPQQLGKISIKMSIQDSILTVEISASSTKTQNILLANLDDIKSMLQTHLSHSNQVNDLTNASQSNNYWQDSKENQSNRHQHEQQHNNKNQDDEVKETSTADFLTIMQALNSKLIYKGGD